LRPLRFPSVIELEICAFAVSFIPFAPFAVSFAPFAVPFAPLRLSFLFHVGRRAFHVSGVAFQVLTAFFCGVGRVLGILLRGELSLFLKKTN